MPRIIPVYILFFLVFNSACDRRDGFMDFRGPQSVEEPEIPTPLIEPPPVDETRFGTFDIDIREISSTSNLSEIFNFSPPDAVKPAVDIVMALDVSSSMTNEMPLVEQNMGSFLTMFLVDPLAPDVRIWAIAGTSNSDLSVTFPPDVLSHSNFELLDPFITHPDHVRFVGSENGLGIACDFAVGYYAPIRLVRRPNAKLYALFVTDDDAKSEKPGNARGKTADECISEIKAHPNLGPISFNGFIGKDKAVCPKITRVGHEYMKLAQMPDYLGVTEHICRQDWDQMFQTFGASVIVQNPPDAVFKLVNFTSDAVFGGVQVSGVELGSNQYTFDPNTKLLTVSSEVSMRLGDKIIAKYSRVTKNISRHYSIPSFPNGGILEEVLIDGVTLNSTQYSFDSPSHTLTISRSVSLHLGQAVIVRYRYQSSAGITP